MTQPRRRPYIRQNPRVSDPGPPEQWCPAHGAYRPAAEMTYLQREATRDGVDPGKARAMLDRASLLRRHCPQCNGPAPSDLDWATRLREEIHPPGPAFVMPPRELVDPDGARQ